MLDGFVLSHRLVLFQPNDQTRIRDFVLESPVRALYFETLDPINEVLFRTFRDAYLQSIGVELHMAEVLKKYIGGLTPIERLVLEIVLLHRLNCFYISRERELGQQDPLVHRALVITGAMLQDRLTLLLLDVHGDEYDRIYNLGRQNGQMSRDSWDVNFLGACAVVRVVRGLNANERTKSIFLSNPLDDADFGIDLFVSREDRDLAISVKSHKTPDLMSATIFPFQPLQQGHEQQIFNGAVLAKDYYGIHFIPVLAVVGRNGTQPFDLELHREDVEALGRVL